MQLVVEDNSDSDQLRTWLQEGISDQRLSYRHSSTPVSMAQNFDRAMTLALGEYVCFIGDDDGVNPEIIDAAQWAKDNDFDALVPSSPISYVWPDLHMTSRGSLRAGEIIIRRFSGAITSPDPDSEMLKCALDAGQNFHKLPKIYYGIVRRTCMDRVKETTGTYFPGISPDMASAVAVANFAKRICHIDYPLFVPGSSAGSNAGLGGLKKHVGWLRDQPHLPATCERDWSDIVPLFFSVQTIWAEAAVNAMKATGRMDLLKHFNVPKLYSACYIFHHHYYVRAGSNYFGALHAVKRGNLVGTFQFFRWFCYWWALRAKSLVLRFARNSSGKGSFRKNGLQNIDEAVQATTEFLIGTGTHFPGFGGERDHM
jgi:glycosyltransferase involved in cell wall biosynthesis